MNMMILIVAMMIHLDLIILIVIVIKTLGLAINHHHRGSHCHIHLIRCLLVSLEKLEWESTKLMINVVWTCIRYLCFNLIWLIYNTYWLELLILWFADTFLILVLICLQPPHSTIYKNNLQWVQEMGWMAAMHASNIWCLHSTLYFG